MIHQTPQTAQTAQELERECMGTIWRTCDDMARAAEAGNHASLKTHFDFLKEQMQRLETIRKGVRQTPRRL